MRVGVYIDGFNLFYGLKRFENGGAKYRWLNVGALVQYLRPDDRISLIRYFTARVDGRKDILSPRRQQVYLRALKTIPNLTVHEGEFRTDKRRMLLVNPPDPANPYVNVWRTEEKGSDVSLATYLVADAFRSRFDLAIVISNDADLVEPISVVQHEVGLPVGVYNPQERYSGRIAKVASFYVKVDEVAFSTCQFPDELLDQDGRTIHKPPAWRTGI